MMFFFFFLLTIFMFISFNMEHFFDALDLVPSNWSVSMLARCVDAMSRVSPRHVHCFSSIGKIFAVINPFDD